MSQLRGFLKRITGDNVSYDALTKQPITDAELKLKLFNDATVTSIGGIETYMKSMTKLVDLHLGDKFNECKELFARYDRPNDQIMGTVFGRISEIQKEIALEVSELVKNIELNVLKPLQDYQKELTTVKENKKELKDAYDKIEQCRQNLDKSKRDLDSSQKTISQSHRITMMKEFETKRFNELNKLEDKLTKSEKELDEATSVANEKYDKYTESLYKRIADECELSNYYLNYLKSQHTYHRRALEKLNNLIPGVENSIRNYHKKPVFQQPLEEYVTRSLRSSTRSDQQQIMVSPVIRKLIEGMCKQNVFSEEGIFRIAGSRVKMNCVVYAINSGYLDYLDMANDFDVHCLAGVLKQYIRELPDSILCNHLYDEWIRAIKSPNKLEAFEHALDKLPRVNYDNLRYLIKFLARIVENSDQTKMTNSNMGICFGVSLLSSNNLMNSSNSSSSSSLNTSASDATAYSTSGKSIDMATATNVFDFLLTNHLSLFPGDVHFTTTNLTSKPSFISRSNVMNGYANRTDQLSQQQQQQQPPVMQRRIITNSGSNTSSTEVSTASDTTEQSSPTVRSYLVHTSPSSSTGSSSSASNTLNISNMNRHIKKSSYDSRAIEDDKYSSNNSLNSIGSKSFQSAQIANQNDSLSTSPKQKSKKQAPAPPPSNNTNSKLNDPNADLSQSNISIVMPSVPTILTAESTPNTSIYPKLQPKDFNSISTSVSNTIKGANEISITATQQSNHQTTTRILEKPNQPPPSIPNRPPPIGFNVSLNGADCASSSPPPQVELAYPVVNTTNATFTNSALLSSSSLSTHSTSSASSSSSSQEMLNTTHTINTTSTAASSLSSSSKAPKPAVPRRPGGLIAAQISKLNRNSNDFIHHDDEDQPQPVKTSSEITSL